MDFWTIDNLKAIALAVAVMVFLLAGLAANVKHQHPNANYWAILAGVFVQFFGFGPRKRAESAGNVRVVMTGHGRGEVWIDGVKVERVRGFEIGANTGQLNQIKLLVHAETIDIKGVFDVTTIEDESRRVKFTHYPDSDTQAAQ